jgi:hypothetical protein
MLLRTSMPTASRSFFSLGAADSLVRSMSTSGVSAVVGVATGFVIGSGRSAACAAEETGEESTAAASPSPSANLAIETSLRRDVSLLRGMVEQR